MKNNKKGAALMQVLLITIILAGIATMLLRASLSRTTSARKTRRAVSGQVLIQACMAEVNTIWSKKTPEAFRRDMNVDSEDGPYMYCSGTSTAADCPAANRVKDYVCTISNPHGNPYKVKASFEKDLSNGQWNLVYEITQGSEDL